MRVSIVYTATQNLNVGRTQILQTNEPNHIEEQIKGPDHGQTTHAVKRKLWREMNRELSREYITNAQPSLFNITKFQVHQPGDCVKQRACPSQIRQRRQNGVHVDEHVCE